MNALSTPKLVWKRLVDDRVLLASIFAGITIAATLVATVPVFFSSLERLALDLDIDRLARPGSNINVTANNIALTPGELSATERALADVIERDISYVFDRRERFLLSDDYLAGLPQNALPEPGTSNRDASRAYLRSYTNLEQHVAVVAGRLAGGDVRSGPDGPVVEAVISQATVEKFQLGVGSEVVVASRLGARTVVTARIVGVIAAIEPRSDYWTPLMNSRVFLDPLEEVIEVEGEDIQFNPDVPPVPLFVTQQGMLASIGRAYPGTLIDSWWFVLVDTERLKDWSSGEASRRLAAFDADLRAAIPGTKVSTGITRVLDRFDRRSFFARIPLLLLVAILVVTVFFYLYMVVSYLVVSREADMALMKTRGVGMLHLLRLYTLEGLVLTTAGVILAPFVAMGIVALLGKLPYFADMTLGDFLPVRLALAPFALAAAAGVLSMIIFVLPGAMGARAGLLAHKLWSSRPPAVPFFHRYYMDVALLVLGGLAFWELSSRGQFVSGGLLKDVEINETLLLAPVLFLVMVALVFVRFFPLLVRYLGGETDGLVHLLAGAIILVLGGGIAVREIREAAGLTWLAPDALLAALAVAYWATSRAGGIRLKLAGLVVQVGLAAWFLALEPLAPGQPLLAPTIGLIVLVPAQVLFLLLRVSTRAIPIWLMMGLWHMGRNPLQYTWLVLLLVMATGVGILSTTVGGTLDRSQRERVMYDLASDLRADIIITDIQGGKDALKERSLLTPGVVGTAVALRASGRVGPASMEVLALESREFSFISWYRKDFSTGPLPEVMELLQPAYPLRSIELPEGARSVGLWLKHGDGLLSSISIWIVLEDRTGTPRTVSLGRLGEPGWHQLRGEVPTSLQPPIRITSVQINEPGFGAVQTPGAIAIDDIHVTVGAEDVLRVLDGFEGEMRWKALITSELSSDSVTIVGQDPFSGASSALFSFGKENIQGIRGFYVPPTDGPLPVVISSALAAATGVREGNFFTASIAQRGVVVVVRGVVQYFPTMRRENGRFMLADLDTALGHLNTLGGMNIALRPNELFIAENPSTPQPVRESISSAGLLSSGVRHRATELEAVRLDPLSSAGWNAMVVLALTVAVLAAAFGYLTYLLLFANRSRSEMGFLQSLGLSRGQVLGLLGFEHLAIAAMGLGLGTWAGFQMSRLMVSPLAVTETGEPVVPPFVLTTDWGMMLPTYGAMVLVFLSALVFVNRSVLRLELHAISRVEG